jgi:hypothetical protein
MFVPTNSCWISGETLARADARYVEFTLAMPDNDHFTIRQANALETTLERLK